MPVLFVVCVACVCVCVCERGTVDGESPLTVTSAGQENFPVVFHNGTFLSEFFFWIAKKSNQV